MRSRGIDGLLGRHGVGAVQHGTAVQVSVHFESVCVCVFVCACEGLLVNMRRHRRPYGRTMLHVSHSLVTISMYDVVP